MSVASNELAHITKDFAHKRYCSQKKAIAHNFSLNCMTTIYDYDK